ncbi:MAG: hypothetical protein HC936_00470 [Leptolyngbyaceae cyanobacterium SU_3_3]|nr:hypothetical protein [Leptolyngbyaceae cyanobacterium SU_3_3]
MHILVNNRINIRRPNQQSQPSEDCIHIITSSRVAAARIWGRSGDGSKSAHANWRIFPGKPRAGHLRQLAHAGGVVPYSVTT